MELAGLSVATAIAEVYKSSEYKRVLAICDPGNNGASLYWSCYSDEDLPVDLSNDFDILVDAMFHFSFHGTSRPPFDDLIQRLVRVQNHDQAHQKSPVIVSIDIPSGWHVKEGDISGEGIKPHMLVSLTAPKLCAKKFCGPHHFIGGRFVPPSIVDEYKLQLPPYPGTSMCVRIGKPPQIDISALRENYISPEFIEEQVEDDVFDQFQKWFDDAVAAGLREPNAMALSTAGKDGKPYTNYESRKAHEISENPHASLLFYWDGLNHQVRMEGFVQKVSDEESEQYFHSHPQGSQIGAIVSKSLIPKPKQWGGYRLKPELFEFWLGQQSHLHDRLQYSLVEIDAKRVWKIDRLAP
ncbi:hypothetical protein F0562_035689 [Nyssa sinensis]|uniref:pyridoxal 5'-phosphate synthase n=1 Tax=Nyssa sinensis TaxID=561372 RepID=A0A5J5ADL1_9ASTE|nr:hypothetical protein F0562_035689 [Nyssa sinensis]